MWFKKKSVLQAEHHHDTEKSADGSTDLRTTADDYGNTSSSIDYSGLPSAADAGNYFYLPALGYYNSGRLYDVAYFGYYWSSSASPRSYNEAYYLSFSSGLVRVSCYGRPFRISGYRVEPTFE